MKIYTTYTIFYNDLNYRIMETENAQVRSILIDLQLELMRHKKNGTLIENWKE